MIEESWNCVNNACVDPQDETGIYESLEECEDNSRFIEPVNSLWRFKSML